MHGFELQSLIDGYMTDVEEPIIKQQGVISLYPNPTDGKITIIGLTSPSLISIYDLNGNELKQIQSFYNSIDIADFPSGLYIFKIKTKDYAVTKRIVKIE